MGPCCILADAAARLWEQTCWKRMQGCGCYTASILSSHHLQTRLLQYDSHSIPPPNTYIWKVDAFLLHCFCANRSRSTFSQHCSFQCTKMWTERMVVGGTRWRKWNLQYIYIFVCVMADCFEGSIFETEPAGYNPPIMAPPSFLSLFCQHAPLSTPYFWLSMIICHTLDSKHAALTPPFSRLVFYSARFFHNRSARWFTEALWKAPPQDQTVAFQTSRVQFGTAAIKATTFTEICVF